ncbi:MFS general substrate transporter [Dentipellis sp. KUC8613]|nr:MFS general substrate transporter [Dentipellis sp. KUC8613]
MPERAQHRQDSVHTPVPVVRVHQVTSRDSSKDHTFLLANVQFVALCWTQFLAGWNDASTGPLLPRVQAVYNVGFAIVSLIFLMNSVGYVVGSLLNIVLTDKLGFGKTIVLGVSSLLIGYSIQASAPPFPVFVIGFFINGFGIALQGAQSSGYVASYKGRFDPAARMGFLHASYGAGALFAPLVSTQFAQLHRWSFYYMISLALAFTNSLFLSVVFKFKRQEECLAQIGLVQDDDGLPRNEGNKYRQIFRLKALHLLAFFSLVYVGTEVTIGGWIVTFIIQIRGGGKSSGYISTGFFAGIMVGRATLIWLNRKLGERTAIFIYVILAIGLELVVWLVPSLVGSAVAIALVGVLLGPLYPVAMNMARRILPSSLLTGCIGWIAGFGQTGSAILPFLTGVIASRAGIRSLQPLLVGMMALMVVIWAFVPKSRSRSD